jgi:Arc/MetJ family transcription regulator
VTKNLTLAIEEDLLDRARVLAAMKRTTVNAMVREFLDREVRREGDGAKRAEAWSNLFKESDAIVRTARPQGACEPFDRNAYYEEMMRERGLL